MTAIATLPETGTWTIDPAHTFIEFSVRHLGLARVRGSFSSLSGEIRVGETPEETSLEVRIDAGSLDTGEDDRDEHLRSEDFLAAEAHPELTFVSTGVRGMSDRFEVDGELTIRGETRPVTLDVEQSGVVTDPWGNERVIFRAETTIDREAWGLTWNQALETGGFLVGKKVDIEIQGQATKD